MKQVLSFFLVCAICNSCVRHCSIDNRTRFDVEMVTSKGTMIIRLSDSTPLYRDNFIKLIKAHYYDSTLFHFVCKDFIIAAGDPESRHALPGQPLGKGGPGYCLPPQISSSLFPVKGVIAAIREQDNVNPKKLSNGSQFYLMQGYKYSDTELDEEEEKFGLRLTAYERKLYKEEGGIPHLYEYSSIFGYVIQGLDVIDSIASVTAKNYRPVTDIRILSINLIKQ